MDKKISDLVAESGQDDASDLVVELLVSDKKRLPSGMSKNGSFSKANSLFVAGGGADPS